MSSEHKIQAEFVTWCQDNSDKVPNLHRIFAIPNGGKRDARTGAILKAEGVQAGVPDLFLPVPIGSRKGLFIELKTENGRASPPQKEWLAFLSEMGYMAVECRGLEEAKAAIKFYYGEVR
jgi:hypothetical protein